MTQGTQFNLNDIVRFACNPGYVLQGAIKSHCQPNGQWSNALPRCKSKSCDFIESNPDCVFVCLCEFVTLPGSEKTAVALKFTLDCSIQLGFIAQHGAKHTNILLYVSRNELNDGLIL